MRTVWFYVCLVLATAFASGAGAATLSGDTIGFDLNDGQRTNNSIFVGSGADLSIAFSYYDFNAGADGDLFSIDVRGTFPGFASLGPKFTIELTDLDFSGGEILTDFVILNSVFAVDSISTTANSLTLSLFEGLNGPGTVFSGRFITAPVPLPPSALLLLGALGAVVGLARRGRA